MNVWTFFDKDRVLFSEEWKWDVGHAAIFTAPDTAIKLARQRGYFFQSPVMFSNSGAALVVDI